MFGKNLIIFRSVLKKTIAVCGPSDEKNIKEYFLILEE